MRKLRVGDRVDMLDGSYAFGIDKGGFSNDCNCFNGDREDMRVVTVGLQTMERAHEDARAGDFDAVCDILVTNDEGGFWFTRSDQVALLNPEHTISFDGEKEVTISDKSFEALKRALR